MIAIICAFKKEVSEFLKDYKIKSNYKLGKSDIFIADYLSKNIIIGVTGIGKTNSAMATQFIIDKFNPKKIVVVGYAGGINGDLNIGNLIIAKKIFHYDFDLRPFVKERFTNTDNRKYFYSDLNLLEDLKELNILKDDNFFCGTMATTDKFITEKEDKKNMLLENIDFCDMESASILQVATYNKIPALIIKKISDK